MDFEQQVRHYKEVRARISGVRPVVRTETKRGSAYAPAHRPLSDPRKEIMQICAEEFGTSVKEMRGTLRFTNIKQARWKAAWMLYQRGGMSVAGIGRYLNKHHATILHALKMHGEDKA